MSKLRLRYKHRLMCGDSTDKSDVDLLMDGDMADFCFTSPPYSNQRDYRGDLELEPKHLAKFLDAPCDLFAVNLGLKFKNGILQQYWNDFLDYAKDINLNLYAWNIWCKNNCISLGASKQYFGLNHEFIFMLSKEKPNALNKTVPNKLAGGKNSDHGGGSHVREKDGSLSSRSDYTISDFKHLRSVININSDTTSRTGHPAVFPVLLPEEYLLACSNENEIIYEPFCGSGSTLIACEKTNRKCYGMEIDPHYCSVIIQRYKDFCGKDVVCL